MCVCLQGDLGPFNPGLPVQVPLWLAINLKQRQKCRLLPPEWMDVGEDVEGERGVVGEADLGGRGRPPASGGTRSFHGRSVAHQVKSMNAAQPHLRDAADHR